MMRSESFAYQLAALTLATFCVGGAITTLLITIVPLWVVPLGRAAEWLAAHGFAFPLAQIERALDWGLAQLWRWWDWIDSVAWLNRYGVYLIALATLALVALAVAMTLR